MSRHTVSRVVKFPLLGCFSVLSFLFCGFGVLKESVNAQDLDSFLRAASKTRIESSDIFNGMKIELKTTIHKVRTGRTEQLYETTFNQASHNVWRCDVIEPGEIANVYVKNGSFCFEAYRKKEVDNFEFGVLGFGVDANDQIASSVRFRVGLVDLPTHVFDFDLVDFLQLPEIQVESIRPVKSETGVAAVEIKWSLGKIGAEFSKESFGEIVVLTEDGFLIEKTLFQFGTRNIDTAGPRFLFKTKFKRVDGQLLPFVSTREEPFSTFVYTLTNHTKSVSDSTFYTAESLGLVTPWNPFIWKLIWIALGIVFCFIGAYIVYNKNSRNG